MRNNHSNSTLPLSVQKDIIETISNASNRLTIIVGGTGCGKSTLVPQLLLDKIGHPILCTQPRRLAVVSVSAHVAKQRQTQLGQDDVGYHVGQNRIMTNKTKLVFATAGILLEDLKSNGLETLEKYKVVLIDECHERSAESDLCLVIIRAFMMKHPYADIKIVLMSATFHQGKYRSYFQGVPGCALINTITLETANSINAFYKQVQTHYLTHVMDKVPHHVRHTDTMKQFERTMRLNPDVELEGSDRGKSLTDELLCVMKYLVHALHDEEPIHAKFLIFAPTYRHLEQIHTLLSDMDLDSKTKVLVDVLHSSIDIEDCLSKMQSSFTSTSTTTTTVIAAKNRIQNRHILLASAIADSSVTIPGVSIVIDTCRALEVKWNVKKERHVAKTTWASKSICDQRRGRTGRTCPGRVFRIIEQGFFINNLNDWDQPQLTFASCRDEVLTLLSASNKVFANPQALLNRCLDPPPDMSVNTAIQFLEKIGACDRSTDRNNKVKLRPTDLGRLFASLPFTITDANTIVAGAKKGLLHETLVLVSILRTRPYPILHVFADNDFNEMTQRRFYPEVNPKDAKSVAIANFAAYLNWHLHFKTNIRQKLAMDRFLHCTSVINCGANYLQHEYNPYSTYISHDERSTHDCKVWEWNNDVTKVHLEWCKKYSINPTSVRAIDADVDVALKALYHKDHEPDWLRCQTSSARWSAASLFDQTFESLHNIFQTVYGYDEGNKLCQQLLELQDEGLSIPEVQPDANGVKERMACIHFLRGNCTFGDDCRNAHSYTAPRPVCKFFLSGGCTNTACAFSHKRPQARNNSTNGTLSALPALHSIYEGGALEWFRNNADALVLFGEADFSFTKALKSLQVYPLCVTTNDPLLRKYISGTIVLGDVDATRCHTNADLKMIQGSVRSCAWNFPFTGYDENEAIHTSLISGTFLSVAAYFKSIMKMYDFDEDYMEFALTLQGDQFSRWSVFESAQRSGFQLVWWEEFEHHKFPEYAPKRANFESFPAQHSRFYVFRLDYC
jgi:HrpA-like RNA helicase